jgi:CBS domain-containing protein
MAAQPVYEVMTPRVVSLPADATVAEAAQRMRDEDIGNVLLVDDGQLVGLLTDRDIVVRVLANQLDPALTRASEVCSSGVVSVEASTSTDEAVTIMRTSAVRRLPVVEDGQPIGVVSIGDLAVNQDPKSALASISAATPNH